MAYGPVNTPGITAAELRKEFDEFAASILKGEVCTPMETDGGEVIQTSGGDNILVCGKIPGRAADCKSYTDMAISAAVSSLTRTAEGEYISVR